MTDDRPQPALGNSSSPSSCDSEQTEAVDTMHQREWNGLPIPGRTEELSRREPFLQWPRLPSGPWAESVNLPGPEAPFGDVGAQEPTGTPTEVAAQTEVGAPETPMVGPHSNMGVSALEESLRLETGGGPGEGLAAHRADPSPASPALKEAERLYVASGMTAERARAQARIDLGLEGED
jgi:hypothetical protein